MRTQTNQLPRIFGVVPSINRIHDNFVSLFHANRIVLDLRVCCERSVEDLLDCVFAFKLWRCGRIFLGFADSFEVSFPPSDGFGVC